MTGEFPSVNVLVNNAGIQRRVDLTGEEDWETTRSEIEINLEAPIHLTQLFYPHFAKQKSSRDHECDLRAVFHAAGERAGLLPRQRRRFIRSLCR